MLAISVIGAKSVVHDYRLSLWQHAKNPRAWFFCWLSSLALLAQWMLDQAVSKSNPFVFLGTIAPMFRPNWLSRTCSGLSCVLPACSTNSMRLSPENPKPMSKSVDFSGSFLNPPGGPVFGSAITNLIRRSSFWDRLAGRKMDPEIGSGSSLVRHHGNHFLTNYHVFEPRF